MERMLKELGIKHRYTRPYRPQTGSSGSALNEDLLDGTTFESVAELQDELQQYLLDNTQRPHQAMDGLFRDPTIPIILSTNYLTL